MAYVRAADLDTTAVMQLAPEPEKTIKKPPLVQPKRDYGKLTKKYPYVHRDRQLLEFLDDYGQGKL